MYLQALDSKQNFPYSAPYRCFPFAKRLRVLVDQQMQRGTRYRDVLGQGCLADNGYFQREGEREGEEKRRSDIKRRGLLSTDVKRGGRERGIVREKRSHLQAARGDIATGLVGCAWPRTAVLSSGIPSLRTKARSSSADDSPGLRRSLSNFSRRERRGGASMKARNEPHVQKVRDS